MKLSFLFILLLIPLVTANLNDADNRIDFTYPTTIILNYNGTTINTNHSNSTDFWITLEGDLDNVADILGSEITNDLGWITSASDTWSTNYTFYPNWTRLNENLTNFMSIDSWKTNLTDINNNINLNLTAGKTYANTILANNISSNNASWSSTYNATYAGNINTDSWSLNYTFYYPLIHVYNKTEVDTNFTKFMSIISWNTNLTNIFTQINNNYTSSLGICNANINNNLTSINNNINLNNTNAKLYANTNIAGNLSLALLADGSRTLTGNWNVGGKNITNIDNITMTGKLSFGNGNYIQSNITCVKIQGSTSLLEIC